MSKVPPKNHSKGFRWDVKFKSAPKRGESVKSGRFRGQVSFGDAGKEHRVVDGKHDHTRAWEM